MVHRFLSRSRLEDAKGFTLIELAIMLTVTGLIMVGGFEAIRLQLAKHKIEQTQDAMQEVQHALLGFVTVNGRLPYAAPNDNSGQEDSGRYIGLLPWNTLGVKSVDYWGHAYTYHVTEAFANTGGDFSTESGDLTVKTVGCTTDMLTLLPLIVVSHGQNGQGAYMKNGTQLAGATDVGELENSDDDHTNKNYCYGGDDILMWISTDLLKYQRERSYSGS